MTKKVQKTPISFNEKNSAKKQFGLLDEMILDLKRNLSIQRKVFESLFKAEKVYGPEKTRY